MAVKVLREANADIPAEVLEFADKIDFDVLSNMLCDKLGTLSISLTPGEVEKSYGGYTIKAFSKELRDKCGVMSEVFDTVKIDLFNSVITTDKNTGELYFWCTPHFKYRIKDGGRNGIEICTAVFTEKDGWSIR